MNIIKHFVFFGIIFYSIIVNAALDTEQYKKLREEMVLYQIKQRGIKSEKVLDAMKKVPRHLFIPDIYRNQAYEDHPVIIGEGQTISQPYIVAFMTEALKVKATDKVLEIGTGSGYQAAILAELAREVYTIEIVESLGRRAEKLLINMGYKNIKVKVGDGYKGWKEYAPFDLIIVTCAPDHIPVPLIEQLNEGGRMIIPVGENYSQELIFIEKKDSKIIKQGVLPVIFVPMTGDGVKDRK
ncbi:protein-L-isoaspartate(D-aspartate) O-methyltransferase [Candidatus Poribacteria bacterium]|nr:protein-L-isoaspartate(D-aspartate) O-methyltransferase [Candidatus Poribacteria bacterium]